MNYEPYRSCPICAKRLSELMDKVENGIRWKVYECKNCGSEVWLYPFKRIIEMYKR